MSHLRQDIERRLRDLPGISIAPWKDTGLICIFYRDKEIGHFHGETVLDMRLSPKIIRDENLSRDVSARFHPKRSPKSRWICVAVDRSEDIDHLAHLVALACELRG